MLRVPQILHVFPIAAITLLPACERSRTISELEEPEVAAIEATPADAQLDGVGSSVQLSAVAYDPAGDAVEVDVSWQSLDPEIATVSQQGKVVSVGLGTALIVAAVSAVADTAQVQVREEAAAPPVASEGEFVVFPNDAIALVIGPQIRSGSSANPWPWFDDNAVATGHEHGASFPVELNSGDVYIRSNYYDQAKVQYTNYYRTGDERFLEYARGITDSWWQSVYVREGEAWKESTGAPSPRTSGIEGMMLRALDGRPEFWEWIYNYTNYMLWLTGDRWIDAPDVRLGWRDPGYMLNFAATLSEILPDTFPAAVGGVHTDGAEKRADLRRRVEALAVDYWARLQRPDGSWVHTSGSDNTFETMYVFHTGLLMEAIIKVHRVTGDPTVKATLRDVISRFATHLMVDGVYRGDEPVEGAANGLTWRSFWYFYHGGTIEDSTAYASGGGSWSGPIPYSGKEREQRQLNCMMVHMFGYAYAITDDPQYTEWGDEIFAATFGKGQGPLADASYSLADTDERNYSQCYRSSGQYLAWRAGA